jgi:hypothetical protein
MVMRSWSHKIWSGRRELNPGPLAPHASALAGLRYAPLYKLRADYSVFRPFWQPLVPFKKDRYLHIIEMKKA